MAERQLKAGKKGVLLISTDPAHSLSDAFRKDLSGGKAVETGFPGLSVIEIDPTEALAKEMKSWNKLVKQAKMDEAVGNLKDFQQWIMALPGIDEATALATVVNKLESSKYSMVIFDTAPTGHTIKVLELGLDKISGWGGKLWDMKNMMNMFMDPKDQPKIDVKKEFQKKLESYKEGITKVGKMIQDNEHTTFVIVCIAEHLSINESKRLMLELQKNNVHSSHIVVNQLVASQSLGADAELIAALPGSALGAEPKERVAKALALVDARSAIQRKHLGALTGDSEVSHVVVPVPLLTEEPAGPDGLRAFG